MKINRLLVGTLALVIIAGLSTTSFASAELTGSGEDTVVNHIAVDPIPVVPQVDCGTDTGVIVAFETSRGQSTSEHTIMINVLITEGYTVRWMDITTQDIPACVTKMVISSLGLDDSCIISPVYTPAEAADIATWVTNGGELLLLNDWKGCGDITIPITTALGETDGATFDSPVAFVPLTNYDATNPVTLFNGVDSFEYFASTSYTSSSNAVTTDGPFPAGTQRMIAKKIDNGCAVLTADTDWARDEFIATLDNQNLALNTILYLNECAEPVVVGGELLPIDSTALLLAGAQSTTWMIPVVLSVLGIGLFVVSRKSENS